MGKIGANLLYLVIFTAFVSSAIVGMSIVDENSGLILLTFAEQSVEISERLYNMLSVISKVFTTSVILVLVQLYNASKKNTAITQGTLDAKQNQSLSNDVLIMSSMKFQLENNPLGDQVKSKLIQDELDGAIEKSISLSQTRIDISAAPTSTQIDLKQKFIDGMEVALKNAIDSGDLNLKAKIEGMIEDVKKEIALLLKIK